MQKHNIITISKNDELFPQAFKMVPEPPLNKFYACGNLKLLSAEPRLGIVGSRKVTPYGKEVTINMARAAASAGIVIVSGLALGVDGIAHQAALDAGGKTIAVLPSSFSRIYPASHEFLARRILDNNGLLITEFIKDEQPMKHYFIQRNRLIAALSQQLLVTEAAMGSGTRHTVEFSISLAGEPMAVPADINKHSSSYTNYMLQHGAKPIFSTSDLLSIFGLNENLIKPKYQPQNEFEKSIIDALKTGTLAFNELLDASQLEVTQLNIHLTMLEIKAVIEPVNNKWRLK